MTLAIHFCDCRYTIDQILEKSYKDGYNKKIDIIDSFGVLEVVHVAA